MPRVRDLSVCCVMCGVNAKPRKLVYHRDGPEKSILVTATCMDYKKAGPLLVSTEHRNDAYGKLLLHMLITNVSIKLTW